MKVGAAILGSGNIGSDLMVKMLKSDVLELKILVGVDPESEGLKRAAELGIATSHDGVDGLMASPLWPDVRIVFDATSAAAHDSHAPRVEDAGRKVVDMTPAARGPFVVPVANLNQHLEASNVNMVTCGGQATIPVVWAASQVGRVRYAEIVASIASKSAGPGTRANIDEFTQTTARAIEEVGGAEKGKAIIVLNPAEPPLIMRDTVYSLVEGAEASELERSIRSAIDDVARYVPGYRLAREIVFDDFAQEPLIFDDGTQFRGLKVTTFIEVEGAGDFLPKYAGNLDIMTCAALNVGELLGKAL